MDQTDIIRDAFQPLVARAHRDEGFKRLLLSDPQAAAAQAGLDIPSEIAYLVFPAAEPHVRPAAAC